MMFSRSWDKSWCGQRLCHSDTKIETTLPGVERKACGYLDYDDYTNEEEHKNDEDNMLLEASKGDLLRVNLRAGKPATPPGMSRVARQLPSCFIYFLCSDYCRFCVVNIGVNFAIIVDIFATKVSSFVITNAMFLITVSLLVTNCYPSYQDAP